MKSPKMLCVLHVVLTLLPKEGLMVLRIWSMGLGKTPFQSVLTLFLLHELVFGPYLSANLSASHPFWHLVSVSLSMMIVENHDGGDNTAGDHEHDAVEIGS